MRAILDMAAYKAKEALYSLFELPTDDALRAWDEFPALVTAPIKAEFKPLLAAMRNWRTEILAVFDHP